MTRSSEHWLDVEGILVPPYWRAVSDQIRGGLRQQWVRSAVLWAWSHRPGDVWGVQLRPVVDKVSADEVPGSKSTDERKLPSHDRSGDDASKLLSVLSRVGRMSTFDSQHLEHSLLRTQHSAATHGPHFDTRHGYSHQEILAMIGWLHQGHTVRALHVLGGVLSGGKEDGSEDVSGMGVESSDATSHGASDEILLHIEVAQGVDGSLENALDDLSRDNRLGDDALATTFNPVDSGWFLVGAVISRKGKDDHFGEVLRHDL